MYVVCRYTLKGATTYVHATRIRVLTLVRKSVRSRAAVHRRTKRKLKKEIRGGGFCFTLERDLIGRGGETSCSRRHLCERRCGGGGDGDGGLVKRRRRVAVADTSD